jgi:hypothetical protein
MATLKAAPLFAITMAVGCGSSGSSGSSSNSEDGGQDSTSSSGSSSGGGDSAAPGSDSGSSSGGPRDGSTGEAGMPPPNVDGGGVTPPPAVCTAPIQAADVSHPTTVVGSGTASSCTEALLSAALTKGGIVTFDCGSAAATITVT